MPTLYRTQITLNMNSNVPEDAVQNVLHFVLDELPANLQAGIDATTARIRTFYNAVRPHMSSLVSPGPHQVRYYEALNPNPAGPDFTTTFLLDTAPTGSALPTEVALCTSWRGVPPEGGLETVATNRGRTYLGPLNTATAGADGRPTAGFIANIVAASLALANQAPAAGGKLAIFSRKLASAVPVAGGWVDNEFDTQRSRGRDRTTRNIWTLGA